MQICTAQGRTQGGFPPPPKPKKCCRKMVLFPKALFLVTNFRKIKNSIFLRNFYQKISKFSENFPTICVFRQNAQKMNAQFVNLFVKYAKIMHFLQFSEEKYSKFSEIFSKFAINCLFSPKAQKINAWFVKILLKNAKIMHFSQFS